MVMSSAIECPPTMLAGLAASSPSASESHQAYDRRTRTITYTLFAVLPKRSGSQVHVNVMVTIHSDSDSDENSTKEDPLHQANRKRRLPPGNPQNDSQPGN
ncbi:hypothetical protein BGX38DRAFT_1138709 [Terfezia claveryi]|nr:hypothetical protein BGX38DRAFT_1138709 [Terfezia claveryi]